MRIKEVLPTMPKGVNDNTAVRQLGETTFQEWDSGGACSDGAVQQLPGLKTQVLRRGSWLAAVWTGNWILVNTWFRAWIAGIQHRTLRDVTRETITNRGPFCGAQVVDHTGKSFLRSTGVSRTTL